MADDDGAAGEIAEGFLQRRKGIDIEVVRRLVEQQARSRPASAAWRRWTRLRSPPEQMRRVCAAGRRH